MQAEREKLQGDVSKLSQEKGLVQLRLRSYETQKTRLAPTLEETQWEVSRLQNQALLQGRGACWRLSQGGRRTPTSMFVDPHVYNK